MTHRLRGNRAEHGQTVPLVLMVLVLAVAVALGLVQLSRRVAERAAAGHAADAAALAGAADGRAAAASIAQANHAILVAFRQEGDVVEVEVRRGSARAVARAELSAVLSGE